MRDKQFNNYNEYISNYQRNIDPNDIKVPAGYKVDVFAQGLNTPISMLFTEKDEVIVADSGGAPGSGKVLRLTHQGYDVIATGFNPPVTGINYLNGEIYVSHRGYISVIKEDGTVVDIISGLPSLGDHHNNQVDFGPDGKMYFGQGTATNSAVVGLDNGWVEQHPFFHDYPGSNITLTGENFKTPNIQSEDPDDYACTGAYSPFGFATDPNDKINGTVRASGSLMRANLDGSDLELLVWGLRNPFRLKFDNKNRLFTTNHGSDVRGSRPIANSPDEFHHITSRKWYGWPDFSAGLPVTLPQFQVEGYPKLQFLIKNHPMLPPEPFTTFDPHSAIMGFDYNYNRNFGPYGDVYMSEFGSLAPGTTGGKPLPGVGHRVSKINMKTSEVNVFAINKSGFAASYTGGGGFERPIDVVFGPDGNMYVVDFGVGHEDNPGNIYPGSGVIWRITKL